MPDTIPYTMTLPDGRVVFVAVPERMIRRDRDGSLAFLPEGVRLLDGVRAMAMETPARPSPAYIRSIREALRLTQASFARRLGYSTISVKRWETGSLKPGKAAVLKLRKLSEKAGAQGVLLGV